MAHSIARGSCNAFRSNKTYGQLGLLRYSDDCRSSHCQGLCIRDVRTRAIPWHTNVYFTVYGDGGGDRR